VLYLLSTSSNPATCAEAVTDFIITNNKCLLMHYMWLNIGSLNVYLVGEDLSRTYITSVGNMNDTVAGGVWSMLFIALPVKNSLQRVVITGVRTSQGISGILIDDMSIRPCSDFS
jgi:hypothetical protein